MMILNDNNQLKKLRAETAKATKNRFFNEFISFLQKNLTIGVKHLCCCSHLLASQFNYLLFC